MKKALNKQVTEALYKNPLWRKKIKSDCEKQRVFLTIRDNRIDFYHKGGLLFRFAGSELKTHIKYAAVIDSSSDDDQNYLTESVLGNKKLTPDYFKGYKRIKENCSNYSGIEAAGVSALYHKHSYLSDSDVVVLDIEVSFVSIDAVGNKKDRVDVVLLNKKTGMLQFVEAKHFSNKELWSTKQPPVVKQIERYKAQISDKKKSIIAQYKEYVKCLNTIFDLSLPIPIGIDEQVTMFIFGFDNDQKKGRLNTLINKNPQFAGIKT